MTIEMRNLGSSDIRIAPLVFGGNVFGWTADREKSFALLDAFLDAGFNAIDTADNYVSRIWCGVSETIIGEWMKDRGVRDRIVIITKCGCPMAEDKKGLHPDYMRWAIEGSLRRLQTDYIDVYMSHLADPTVPIEDTLGAHQAFIDEGKARVTACSNYTAAQLREALAAGGEGRARYVALEPHYNVLDRGKFEGELEDVCASNGLGVLPYFALESGFLTGKYRTPADIVGSDREWLVHAHVADPRALALLAALDRVAARHEATVAQVSLAWLLHRPSVTAPIASATSLAQLDDILGATRLHLTEEDMHELDI